MQKGVPFTRCMPRNKLKLCVILCGLVSLHACSGCRRELESVQVSGQSLELEAQKQAPPSDASQDTGPRVIEIRAKKGDDTTSASPSSSVTSIDIASGTSLQPPPKAQQVPPGAIVEETLTKRLTDKFKESNIPFNEKNPPKIYISSQSLSEFSSYYESKGQKVSRMSIPAAVLIRPLLQEHPELSSKIDADALEKVTINQVVVEGTGISAADKYIDPDTLQVVDKLFVTDMPSGMGKKE